MNEFRHVVGEYTSIRSGYYTPLLFYIAGIRHLYPNFNGTQLVFIDEKSDAYLYNPVSGWGSVCCY